LRFDGTYLIIDGKIILNSATASTTSGITVIATFSSSLGNAAYFDYHVFASGAGPNRRRSGTVMTIWDSSSTKYTDTSTIDLGDSTQDIEFKVTNNSGIIEFASITSIYTWQVKTGIRII
jgi:hypothetical protein